MSPEAAPRPAAAEVGAADRALAARWRAPGGGAWSSREWEEYLALKQLVTASLRRWIGQRGRPGVFLYDAVGRGLAVVARLVWRVRPSWRRAGRPAARAEQGPDGMRLVLAGLPIPGNAGTTYGNTVHLWPAPEDPERARVLLNHEYVHVLQARRDGAVFIVRYLAGAWGARRRGKHYYWGNPYEVQAYDVERLLAAHPWLPDVWELPPADDAPPATRLAP